MVDGNHLSSSRINTVFTDRKGTVWLGTYDHGLLRGVQPTPWYQTPWAYLGYGIIGIGLFLVLFLLYQRKNSSKPQTEEHEELQPQESVSEEYADLMKRATLLVEQNLATPGYTVERLAQDLCMDRTGLYKKMMAAIDKTPTAFIRNIRLTHAAQLIREGKLTMNEVAEQTGFSSASYMARCFQEEWNKKPSELRES
ncbi:MAG: helix-turn-helix domain-containing protein [Bacteroidaceae bacterium]|nr:helix-turn-helix domain-containing protein [Bacteroidaceae bacterium]